MARRAGLQLLAGVLIVGAIPIVSTARILQANALRSERAHADATLRSEIQNALRELGSMSANASGRADDLARSKVVQRALILGKRRELERLATRSSGASFFLHGKKVAGPTTPVAAERSVWLTVGGSRVGKVSVSVALDEKLAKRLTSDAPHGPGDRILLTDSGRVLGTRERIVSDGHMVRVGDVTYRAVQAVVPDSDGVRVVALRSEHAIDANVAPYQQRIRYAAIGSFALLLLVALLFAGPLLRLLSDFRRVATQASTDSLTGLPNRRMFDEELALEWRRAERVGHTLALILLDLDDFKSVNDTYGHPAGDAVLRRVGEVLASGVRQVDLAGRYGGEEFGIIVPESDLDGAVSLAERLRASLAGASVELDTKASLTITASFGVAVKGELASAEELLRAADEALYEAKRSGKNRISPEPAPVEATQAAPEPERRRRRPGRPR